MKRISELPADGTLGAWVLVGNVPDENADGWSYRTGAVKTVRAVRSATGEVDAIIDESWSAWAIEKRKDTRFSDTILVGRAATNDICIGHSSVSKLHARIRVHGNELLISDATSSNGTIVNGEKLDATQEVHLETGDLVRFGGCVLQVFSPEHLASILSRLRAP